MMLLIAFILGGFTVIGATKGTRRISDFYAAGGQLHPAPNGLVIAVSTMPAALFAGTLGSFSIFAGICGGLLLIAVLLAPLLQRFGGYTLPDFLADRFPGKSEARAAGIIAILVCCLPLFLGVLLSAGTAVLVMLNFRVTMSACIALVSAILFVTTLLGGMRSLTWAQIAQGAVLIVAVLVTALLLGIRGSVTGSPNDPGFATMLPHPFGLGDQLGRAASIVTLVLGIASFPSILVRSITVATPGAARLSFAWAILFLCPLYFAPQVFRAWFPILDGGNISVLSPWALGIISGVSVAILAASLASAGGLLLTIANMLGNDIYYKSLDPNAPPARWLSASRVSVVLVTLVAALLASAVDGQAIFWGAEASFSLAASAILPALMLGLWWKRANGQGAVSGMFAGLALCLYYLVATRYFPISFYETWSSFSGATFDQVARYATLKDAYVLAQGAAKQAALATLQDKARTLANWWGVSGQCAAVFAVPFGFLVTIVVSLCTPRPPTDIENFVGELGKKDD
jgi:cation/acetate symporter